jgi:hypothetical protein
MRLTAPSVLLCLALAACSESENQAAQDATAPAEAVGYAAAPAPAMPPMAGNQAGDFRFSAGTRDLEERDPNAPQSGEAYIYDHNLTISMASEHIKARFERARDRCQNDPALKCKVTSASFRLVGQPDAPLPIANLSVALPHDSVAPYEESLIALLPGENKDDILIKARNTSSVNVTNQVRDIERRLAQLTNYRERMTELSKRGGAKTDDLIKIEGEISRTQSEIEAIEGQRRDLADRIAKENLSISFEAQSTATDAFQPVAEVWQDSLRVMAASAAAVLGFSLAIIPWIPLLVLLYFLVRWLWRRARRVKT